MNQRSGYRPRDTVPSNNLGFRCCFALMARPAEKRVGQVERWGTSKTFYCTPGILGSLGDKWVGGDDTVVLVIYNSVREF
jgi:hypothetical protein